MTRSIRSGLAAIFLGIVLVATSSVTVAQIPRLISYQGLLTQPSGQPIVDGQYGLVLRLFDAPTGGNLVWEETQQVQVQFGLFNVVLGSVVPLTSVDFLNTQYYLETAISEQPPFARTRLAVVPYAIRAEHAEMAGGLDPDATGAVRSLNGAQGDLVIEAGNGISVTQSGDTIRLTSTVTFAAVQSLTSPQNTMLIGSPSGPNTTVDVRDGAITTTKLADGSVTTSKVIDGGITLQKLAPGLIPTSLPPSGPAGGDLTGTYPNPLIAANAVTTPKLADNNVTTLKLVDVNVTSAKLADGSVTTTKITDDAVTSQKLSPTGVPAGTYGSDNAVPQISVDNAGRIIGASSGPIASFPFPIAAGGDLQGMYPAPLIAPNAVTTSKILNGNVTTAKLADGSVTNPKLGSNSVTSDKILDGTITASDIAAGVIPTTLPPNGPAGGALAGTYPNPTVAVSAGDQLIGAINNAATLQRISETRLTTSGVAAGTYGNGSSNLVPRITVDQYGRVTAATEQAVLSATPSGAAGGDLSGTYPNPQIASGAVGTGKLADGSVTNIKLSANAVTGDKVLDGSLTASDLAPGTIPTTLPPNGPAGGELIGSYPNPQIQSGVITTAKLADGAVSSAKLGDNTVTTNKIVDGTIILSDLAPGLIPTTLPPSGPAGGALAGTYPNPTVAPTAGDQLLTAINNGATTGKLADNRLNTTGVTAGTYGDGAAGIVPRMTIDQYGRITMAVDQMITSAQPSGPATGDLSGTYPSPVLATSAGAGSRIVDAVRADYLAGDADINTANNIVVLDGSNRLPAANGSLLTNLNASAITAGVLPINSGGTNSSTALSNNRVMLSSGGKIIESSVLNFGQIIIGVDATVLPTSGSIIANPGLSVTFTSPNLTIAKVDARILPGSANDQTIRWDAGIGTWVPNTNTIATSVGNVTTQGVVVNGTTETKGNSSLGTNAGSVNSFGSGAGTFNTVGSAASTNTIRGTTSINTSTDANTNIGMIAGASSGVMIAAGSNGNLVLENIDAEAPYAFLTLNPNRNVRSNLGTTIAAEGVQYQNGAFRLGGENATTNPLQSTRYVNVSFDRLRFTTSNGAKTIIDLNGQQPDVNFTVTANVNATGTDLTTIGNAGSKTIIGGELDPRGVIRNSAGKVIVPDVFVQTGQAQINYGGNENTFIGNPAGAGDQTLQVAVGQGANGNFKLVNIKNDPNITNMLWLDGSKNVRYQSLDNMDDEGLTFQAHRFRLGAAESDATPTRTNSFDENRFVNLDQYVLNFTNGSEGANGSTFFLVDGENGGVPGIGATSVTRINRTGSASTEIGNLNTIVDIDGNVSVNTSVLGSTTIGANGNSTRLLSKTILIGRGAYATTVNIGSTGNATTTLRAPTNVNVSGNGATTIGNVVAGGPVAFRANNNITIDPAAVSNNVVMNNIQADIVPFKLMSMNASNRLRTSSLSGPGNSGGMANEGVMYETGAFRLGHSTNGSNPIVSNRFVRLNGGNLTFNTATVKLLEMTSTGNVNIHTTGTGTTTIGSAASKTFVEGELEVELDTRITDDLSVIENDAEHVATIENTNGSDGDGLLIKLGRTHGAWNGSSYLQIANPATILAGSTLNTVKGWLNGASFQVSDLWTIFPGAAIAGALAAVTNTVIDEINDGLNLPLQFFPEVTVIPATNITLPDIPEIKVPEFYVEVIPEICIPYIGCTPCVCGTVGGWVLFGGVVIPDINIPRVAVGPYSIPAIPNIPTTGLPTIAIPDFRGVDVTNSLTRENHYVTFEDKAGRETGSIVAESVAGWRDNTVLDDVYLTTLAASWIGIDLLDAAVSGYTEIVKLVDSYNEIGVAYESGNGDYAEWLERESINEHIGPGDVVGVRGGKISKNVQGAEQVMVVSHKPIVLGNMPQASKRPLGNDVAFMGQVPVKVMGAVASGDYIVAKGSIRGYGVAVHPSMMTPEDHELAVGRSWENAPQPGPKMVNTVIGVQNGAWANDVNKLEETQNATDRRINSLESILREKLGIDVSTDEKVARP